VIGNPLGSSRESDMVADGIVYEGPPINDRGTLDRLPEELQDLLRTLNGFIALRGGLHVRGACVEPTWHSLANAWKGQQAIHELYPTVHEVDIPFAEDCVGDQFLLRDGSVVKLDAELGELHQVSEDLQGFWDLAKAHPEQLIATGALESDAGGSLKPGNLLHVFPPYCLESESVRSARAMDALELRDWHATLSKELADLPDGSTVKFTMKE